MAGVDAIVFTVQDPPSVEYRRHPRVFGCMAEGVANGFVIIQRHPSKRPDLGAAGSPVDSVPAVHKDPLSIAKNVRDVAFVHKTLWPNGEKSELIEAAILVGDARVVDNVKELEAASVRENVPHERPAGD